MTIELSKTEVLAMNGLRRSGWTFEPDMPTTTTEQITITQPEETGQDDAVNCETLVELGWDVDGGADFVVLTKTFKP